MTMMMTMKWVRWCWLTWTMRVGGCGNVVHVDEIVPRTPAHLVVSAEPEMMPTAAAAFHKSLFSLVRRLRTTGPIYKISYDNLTIILR